MIRITLGEFKRITRGLPDDALICCQSDEEGNSTSTCIEVFVGKVGRDVVMNYAGKEYHFTDGEDIEGIDLTKDKDRIIITMRPSL